MVEKKCCTVYHMLLWFIYFYKIFILLFYIFDIFVYSDQFETSIILQSRAEQAGAPCECWRWVWGWVTLQVSWPCWYRQSCSAPPPSSSACSLISLMSSRVPVSVTTQPDSRLRRRKYSCLWWPRVTTHHQGEAQRASQGTGLTRTQPAEACQNSFGTGRRHGPVEGMEFCIQARTA